MKKVLKYIINLKVKVKLVFRGGDSMILVYIVSLDMGLIAPNQIPKHRYEEVRIVAENMGLGHLFE